MFFLGVNFSSGVMERLFVPLIRDKWKADVLGYLSTVMGVGMLSGTLVMSAWGGGKRKVYTLLGINLVGSFFLILAGVRASIPLLAGAAFCFMFPPPIFDASSPTLCQATVAPRVSWSD